MEARIHKTRKTVTLADGTIRVYESQYTYTPVDKSAKITKGKVIEKVKSASPEKLREAYEILTKDD